MNNAVPSWTGPLIPAATLGTGATLATETVTVLPAAQVPSSSVAVAEIVYVPLSSKMCRTVAGLPATVWAGVPSPQLIVQWSMTLAPGSLAERLSAYTDPSSAAAAPDRASVG